MSFDADQIKQLDGPLDKSKVRERSQAGRSLSYIEAWHAIAEANRIFGFDMWDRETTETRQLGDPREVDGKFRVGYTSRVRVTVYTATGGKIIREGTGFGSGIDKDPHQAHESAIKEAESDAMKRALMTFGNPFGLALYDKTQANVAEALVTADQASQVQALAEDVGADLPRFLAYLKVKHIADIPAADFDRAMKALEAKREAK